MSRRAFAWGFALALSCATAAAARDTAADGRVFDRAWTLVTHRYWDRSKLGPDWLAARTADRAAALAAPDERRFYIKLNAVLGRLGDSHVYAASPTELAFARHSAREHGESGFGFDAVQTDGRWLIHTIDKAGPAAAAGMQIGWELLSIAGQPVDVDRHFGEGETAAVALRDENGARHAMTLTGTRLPAEPDRRVTRLPGDILVLALDQFGGGDDRWLARALATAPSPTGVILDLRENDGGDASVLDRIAGKLVARRRVILTLISRRTQDETTIGAGPGSYRGPLAVLVGPRTASAAEALAAFLEEDKRACTIGETTAGELTGGVEHRLPDGGQLTVAEFDIRTAAGTRLEGKGFTPHYPARATLAQLRAGADPVMAEAAALIRRGACEKGSEEGA